MKTFTRSLFTFLLLTGGFIYAQEFSVSIPTTDNYGGLLYPTKAGSIYQFQIKVKNLDTITCTVGIDKSGMGVVKDWISIDNNSQTIAPGQTVTYILTVTIPSSADDADYPLPLTFTAKDANNGDHSFLYTTQTIIVDKSVPDVPTFSVSPKSTALYVSSWQSFDSRSIGYTSVNQSSGINGIKTYNVTILNSADQVLQTKDFAATSSNYYTFGSLTGNTDYKVRITAYDLAGNSNLAVKSTKTAPTAPTLSLSKASYCYINLTWSTSAGATKYKVYNSTNTPAVLLATVNTTTYQVTQSIVPSSTYKFYVIAMNSSNAESDNSNTLTVPTPALVTPIISGGQTVCSSGATFTVSNLPTSDCSLTWGKGSYLSLFSSSGNSATFKATGSGVSYISATYTTSCASQSQNRTVDAGTPNPGPITIYWDAPPNRFTASIEGNVSATSYKWYLNGVLMYNRLLDAVIFARQITRCDYRYDVDVYTVNACGTSTRSHTDRSEPPCYESFTISPNPANSEITIAQNEELATTSTDQKEAKMIESFKIVDNFGMVYVDKKLDKLTKSTTVNISNLKTGSYLIIINSGAEEESYVLIKN